MNFLIIDVWKETIKIKTTILEIDILVLLERRRKKIKGVKQKTK